MSVETTCGPADRLNERCFCISLDRAELQRSFESRLADTDATGGLPVAAADLFSDAPVFVRRPDVEAMEQVVRAIDRLSQNVAYQKHVLQWAPPIARFDPGPVGAFTGYDFHITGAGPKLIEINTNAGGAFLNARLAWAQRACCREVQQAMRTSAELDAFDASVVAMFEAEWTHQKGTGRPEAIAIVDDDPERQPMYLEFALARALLNAHGIRTRVVGPEKLRLRGRALTVDDARVDLVYNRLVDFPLAAPDHAVLRKAYLDGSVVLTPNPRAHALLADKRNLGALGNSHLLHGFGVEDATVRLLTTAVPHTEVVTPENADDLWRSRRDWFFKPVTGYGSKGVYRGAKITRGVFEQIRQGGYVAQSYVPPGERLLAVGGRSQPLKVDVRLYTYAGQVLLPAARMYRGQATNLRTAGGGFAPVFQI